MLRGNRFLAKAEEAPGAQLPWDCAHGSDSQAAKQPSSKAARQARQLGSQAARGSQRQPEAARGSQAASQEPTQESMPNLPTKIRWLKICRTFPMDTRIPPLNIQILLESNPLKSRI